jgi:uncharacterized Zn finger protein
MIDVGCPECGHAPTDDSVVESRLSNLGYHHEDVTLECSNCGHTWQHGIPKGDVDDDTWVCPACGGDFVPHFVYVFPPKDEVRVRPKCQDCYYVPDKPIVMDVSNNGHSLRWFVGHHTVTGDKEDAKDNTY